MRILTTTLFLLLLSGCASGPDFRADYDPSVDFSAYKTYGWVGQLGTDKAGYSTLTTNHFKEAVSREMEALGYTFSIENPDLLVNFSANVEQNVDVRSRPRASVNVGYSRYYGYRYGMYTTFPLYETEVQTVRYETGTANIDVIDAAKRQLVWEGLAEGRLNKKAMENPRAAISRVVSAIFERFPRVAAGG